ncbi:DUF2231 domain-containing protein [Sphingomonas glaciei]|uniref:DUF2231 domain-containing protein n=1 Tax=Sphingomonas glaciei TaxID=2938948 RepID=A0ABY5MUN3_9SPHN|nr:DUF2231 domain-containing protein [Sphingomonas glaciei]UUR08199.1 DUF2231 domain-containing protein [Sphingomonas glaciei]
MNGDNPRSTAQIGGHPIHPLLIPFPIVSFIGVLVTDIMWLTTREGGWATASNWLLGAGLLTALLAAAAGMADYLGDDRVKRIGAATRHMIANIVVMTLEAVNLVARLTGGTDQVGTLGVWLSLASVVILAYSGWLGGELVYKHRVGVQDRGGPGDGGAGLPDQPATDRKFSRDRR